MNLTRRDFLYRVGLTAAVAGAGPLARPLRAFAPNGKARALVAIYLRGGADFLNMVIPYKDKRYEEVRPNLALNLADGVVPIGSHWGLHPALADLAPLFEAEQLAPIVCTGSPHETRSHFDAQDFMERGAPGIRTIYTGWLNRYLTATQAADASEFRGMAPQGLLPRSLRGNFPVLAVPEKIDRNRGMKTLDRFEDFYGKDGMAGLEEARERQEMGEMDARTGEADRGEQVVESGKITIETLKRYNKILSEQRAASKSAGYSGSQFAKRLAQIAMVIRSGEGLEVAAVDYDRWDHHINQGGVEGLQANMLGDLGSNLAAFVRDLGPLIDQTLVVVMTEFGRTVRENGNDGTDHGRGSGMFLVGGGVKGGKVHGDWRGLEDRVLVEGRDLPVTTDFRDVFAACLESQFDFKPPKDFFPEYRPGRLRLF